MFSDLAQQYTNLCCGVCTSIYSVVIVANAEGDTNGASSTASHVDRSCTVHVKMWRTLELNS